MIILNGFYDDGKITLNDKTPPRVKGNVKIILEIDKEPNMVAKNYISVPMIWAASTIMQI